MLNSGVSGKLSLIQISWLRTEQDAEWLESADPDLLAKSLNRLRVKGFFRKGADGL